MNYKILTVLLLSTFACKAQTPIIDIGDKYTELVDGAYLKDVNNQLDKFVGTWVYTNGNTSLTITFQKKTQVYNDSWYEDLLVGEYKYVEDGVEKINTLSNLNAPEYLANPYNHNLVGCLIISKRRFPGCSNCDDDEKRVKIDVIDPDPEVAYLDGTLAMGLRYINDLTPKMQIDFARKGTTLKPADAPDGPNLPLGRYVLTKQ